MTHIRGVVGFDSYTATNFFSHTARFDDWLNFVGGAFSMRRVSNDSKYFLIFEDPPRFTFPAQKPQNIVSSTRRRKNGLRFLFLQRSNEHQVDNRASCLLRRLG
jgi:hypothetical protein